MFLSVVPNGCFQFFRGIENSIRSFNHMEEGCSFHDAGCDPSDKTCNPEVGQTGRRDFKISKFFSLILFNDIIGQIHNSGYTICVDQEEGFCGMEYMSEDPQSTTWITGDEHCSSSFLSHRGEPKRICSFGKNTFRSFRQPFQLRVHTTPNDKSSFMTNGFKLHYKQIPCSLYQ